MQIWIDGDACPNKIKEILFRAAVRTTTTLILVANQTIAIPKSPFIKRWQVAAGFDAADNKIADHVQPRDLVITADIPLANIVVEKKAFALNPRGELYCESNIKQILAMRNLNESLRSNGLLQSGGAKINPTDVRRFSNNLDKILARNS